MIPDCLRTMFKDRGWKMVGRYRYMGEIDGAKIGVVLATMSPSYDRFALNKKDNESLLQAKHDGKVDQAFVVAAKLNGSGPPEYCTAVDAEEFQAVLARQTPRPGRFGDFWTLYLSEFTDDEWTM